MTFGNKVKKNQKKFGKSFQNDDSLCMRWLLRIFSLARTSPEHKPFYGGLHEDRI